ncbi:MAG: GSCFA domain-containing protein [Bacteroidetes bacterium]|nr:GSCFA domain-containing protein [Bacteroidota bacterium]
MEFMLDITINGPERKIGYQDPVLLTGSCFTEHIGNYLKELKFDILQNPNGILFDPYSVTNNLISYIENKKYTESDLFYLNELWQSWNHHSIFSNTDKDACLNAINESQNNAHHFLQRAKWLIITLGSSFSYRLIDGNIPVANCHRAPAQWFNKHLMTIEETHAALDACIHRIFKFNPGINIVFTVSPVRHIRDGVVENNRSKARLIECVHHLANKFSNIYYFPAYELVIDVLRDYRFYDIDMVHPNYPATEFVLQHFTGSYIDERSQLLMQEVKKIVIAKKHRAFQPATQAHRKFLQAHLEKAKELSDKYPFLDLAEEMQYFTKSME